MQSETIKLGQAFTANGSQWRIRLMAETDIPHIVNYWFDARTQARFQDTIDLSKLGTREEFAAKYSKSLADSSADKPGFTFIIDRNESPVAAVPFVKKDPKGEAQMHCHVWDESHRGQGLMSAIFQQGLKMAFEVTGIEQVVFEPAAADVAINALIQKFGFKPVKTYVTRPSELCFEMEVNRYKVNRGDVFGMD